MSPGVKGEVRNVQRDVKTPWLLGTVAVADYTGLSKNTVLALIHDGRIHARRVTNRYAVHVKELDAFLMFGVSYKRLTRQQKALLNEMGVGI